jgi:cobalt/nickel transport system permease protein
VVCRVLPGTRGQVAAVAFAGWCSTVLASISCAGQLAWSGTVGWPAGFTAMTSVHMAIGVGEGLISALVFVAIQRVRPDLTSEVSGPEPPRPWGELVLYGLLATLGVAIFVAPFACPWPDGLEAVAAKLGFEHAAVTAGPALAPGYHMPGVHWAAGATALAGVAGAVIVFGLALLLARSLVRERAGEVPISKP